MSLPKLMASIGVSLSKDLPLLQRTEWLHNRIFAIFAAELFTIMTPLCIFSKSVPCHL